MPARRIEAGPLLVLLGAGVLLVSLFLDWYAPGLSAWAIFELLDLVLAALAVAGALAAVSHLGGLAIGPDPARLPLISGAALVLMLGTVLDHPPAVGAAETRTGLWLALVGAVLMALGTLLLASRVRISFDIEGRRRRVQPVSRREEAGETLPAFDDDPLGADGPRDAAGGRRPWSRGGADDDARRGSAAGDDVAGTGRARRGSAGEDDVAGTAGGSEAGSRRADAGPLGVDDPVGPPAFEDDEPGRPGA